MFDDIYQNLSRMGYSHPLHPTVTHLTIGLVMGAFIFLILAIVFKRPILLKTARHVMILCLATIPITLVLGYMDWQHFYKGASLFPIKMKILLAGMLVIFLAVSILLAYINESGKGKLLTVQVASLLAVVGLGYLGGELVYGTGRISGAQNETIPVNSVKQGKIVFENNCAMCHFTDQTAVKIGPGLKQLFQMQNLPVSNRVVSEENIRKQLAAPFKDMPEFKGLSEDDIRALIVFLKTI